MADHGVIILSRVAATDIVSFNRSATSGSDLDNGSVFNLLSQQTSAGSAELWKATWPLTGSLAGLWMAVSPEVPITVDGTLQFRGLVTDPRRFYNAAGRVIDAFKPQVGDVIIASSAVIGNAYGASTPYAVASDSSFALSWSGNKLANQLTFDYLNTVYISIGSGNIDNQRVTAYKLVCSQN